MAKNKLVRSDNYNAHKSRAQREKSALRRERAKLEEEDPTLRVKRREVNVPTTIDAKRYYDPTRIVNATTQVTQTELGNVILKEEDTQQTELGNGISEDETTSEKKRTLITTSPNPTRVSYHFLTILSTIFPQSDTIRRGSGKYTIQDIAKFASNRGYANLIVINEDVKKINAIQFITLPNGPTAYFTMTGLQLKQLATHTTHYPELLLTNFTTGLGLEIAGIFKSLIPDRPELQGRQTLTLHNSRDFIFFRRHRYIFTGAGDKVRLQEIGPRFTLKCREVIDGIGRNGKVIWVSNAGLESDRKRMFL